MLVSRDEPDLAVGHQICTQLRTILAHSSLFKHSKSFKLLGRKQKLKDFLLEVCRLENATTLISFLKSKIAFTKENGNAG